MVEPTKSAQEAFKTTGKTTGSTSSGSTGGATGGTIGSSAQGQDASAASRIIGRSTDQPPEGGRISGAAREDSEYSSYGLNKTWEQAMNYSRENPGKSTLIAFGVGLGVGLLMSNGFTTRSRSQRIVPPLMNALSEIASALFR